MTSGASPVVLVGPSGAGKTTLAHRLVADSPRYVFSVSATTRAPRDGEHDGIDYHFVDRVGFDAMVDTGELAEWAEVHGRLYGTPRAELDLAAERGEHVVLDIDVQGARQIRDVVPDARLIFVLPPDIHIMMARLSGRGIETPAEIAKRLRISCVRISCRVYRLGQKVPILRESEMRHGSGSLELNLGRSLLGFPDTSSL